MVPTSRLGLGVRDALSAGAALAQRIPGFVARPAQQRLAMAVADAFESRGVLLAEAGTGSARSRTLSRVAILRRQPRAGLSHQTGACPMMVR